MPTTWILVAHRSGARLFESRGPGSELKKIRELPNPEGRMRARELNTDKASGRAPESSAHGHGVKAPEVDVTEHVAENFARELANILDSGRTHRSFDRLVLVAGPSFLGRLRGSLTAPTQAMVVGSLDKDLPEIEPNALRKHVENIVLV